jgi:uncharacterized protein
MVAVFAIFTIIVAPVSEEIMFRGFLFRGWSEPPVGVTGTIFLTSLLFSLEHIPGNGPLFVVETFCLGVMFGWLRWCSGSIVIPIAIHSLTNLVVDVELAILVSH